jgi:hypothetical protein
MDKKSKYTYEAMESQMCFCGKPLHYSDIAMFEKVEKLVEQLGANVRVVGMGNGKTYAVPRHYIALHGLNAQELPELGFKEVGVNE